MMLPRTRKARRRRVPRGIATLEFVLGLPLILLMMAAIFWLGFTMIGQAEMTVIARHKAWRGRNGMPANGQQAQSIAKRPLFFLQEKSDFVEEEATTKVHVASVFDHFPSPRSKHVVMGGAWDHVDIPLNGPPSMKWHAAMGASALARGIQDAGSQGQVLAGKAEQRMKSLQSKYGNLLNNARQNAASGWNKARQEGEAEVNRSRQLQQQGEAHSNSVNSQ
jgi:hypothetical protein